MKNKFGEILVLFICLLVFPLLVHADVGMPDIKPYDVIVADKDGIKLTDSFNDKTIVVPYDEKITITFEYYDSTKNTLMGYTEYNGVAGEIDLSKVRIADSNKINLDDFIKLTVPQKLYVLEDIDMYNGPSIKYDKIDGMKIPAGTTIEFQYYDSMWAYVEYSGTKGWIYIYKYGYWYSNIENKVAYIPSNKGTVLLTEDIKELKTSYNGTETVKVNIPKDTELEYKYSYKGGQVEDLYVEYDGVKGWLHLEHYYGPYETVGVVRNECVRGIVISDSLYIYNTREDLNSKSNQTVPKGTEFEIIYNYTLLDSSWAYISYDDKGVWVCKDCDGEEEDSNYSVNGDVIVIRKSKKDLDVYEYPNKDAKKIGTLVSGTEVDDYYVYYDKNYDYQDMYHEWSYIKTDNLKGWVLTVNLEKTDKPHKSLCTNFSNPGSVEDPSKPGTEDDENKKLTPVQMALVGVCGAFVGALVVIVVIALVNKKKKNNVA